MCLCISKPCSCAPSGEVAECNPSPTSPPVPSVDVPLACTPLGAQQEIVDFARTIAQDTLGTVAYQVWLVWQEQDPVTGKWSRVLEREISPVEVRESRESLEALAAGQVPTGGVSLRKISPRLFDEDLLRGYIDGKPWTGPTREFFYEIQHKGWCATSRPQQRYRFSLSSVPEHRPSRHEYVVRLTAQFGRRDRGGEDTTTPGDYVPPLDGALLMG